MVENTKVNGKMVRCMEKVCILIQRVLKLLVFGIKEIEFKMEDKLINQRRSWFEHSILIIS